MILANIALALSINYDRKGLFNLQHPSYDRKLHLYYCNNFKVLATGVNAINLFS
jgi:hypothetical protein